jgi:hypothetical protein
MNRVTRAAKTGLAAVAVGVLMAASEFTVARAEGNQAPSAEGWAVIIASLIATGGVLVTTGKNLQSIKIVSADVIEVKDQIRDGLDEMRKAQERKHEDNSKRLDDFNGRLSRIEGAIGRAATLKLARDEREDHDDEHGRRRDR